MKKMLVIFTAMSIITSILISVCTKKQLPTGALDATFTYTYTETPTTTPNMRYDVVVLKAGNPDIGQVVYFKLAAQATWTPVVVNPASGIASFDHISEFGKYDVKISALNTCYDEYNYQVDLHGNSVTVINRNNAPYFEITSDSGFETFGAYKQNVTYTVKLKTDYSYPVNNFTVEGLPNSCSASWDTTTSAMTNDGDFIKLYITTPANYLTNITFTVKAEKANCVASSKISSSMKTISRNWSISSSMEYLWYKRILYDGWGRCAAAEDNYGVAIKTFTFTTIGMPADVNWSIDSVNLQTCGGQGFSGSTQCSNCTADMACQGINSVIYFKSWYTNTYWSHNECLSVITAKIRFYNDKGFNYYHFFRTTTYPGTCVESTCGTDDWEQDPYNGYSRKYNSAVLSGTEQ